MKRILPIALPAGLWLPLAVFLLPLVSTAQVGPFGIGNAAGSDGQPRLLVWLDAGAVSQSPGTDVLTWPDKSGNGNHFTASPSKSPIFRAGVAATNDAPYLEFSRTDNRLVLPNLTFQKEGVSIFYVFRTADATFGLFSFAESDANARQLLVQQSGGQTRFTVQGTEHTTNIGALNNNVWRYAGMVWDGISSPTSWLRSNGTAAPELTQNNVLNGRNSQATGTAVIGHIQGLLNGGYAPSDAFQGELAELIVFDGRVNAAHLRQLNTYFRNKYNVGATGGWDKLQAPAAYRKGLIGIGRENSSSLEHRHARADGLVLRVNAGGISGNFAYLSAAHSGIANQVINSDVPAGVQARWQRDWYIRKDGLNNPSNVQIAFDLGDGINGQFPQQASNYVLLFRSGATGEYSVRTVNEVFMQDKEVVFRVSGSQIATTGYYTLGTRDQQVSPLEGQVVRTWYAFQTGNWNNPLTWTLDGSASPAYVNPDAGIPGINDAVVIGSGRTVTMNLNNCIQQTLELHGTLDMSSTSGHHFGVLSGSGLLRCSGAAGIGNLPSGNMSPFADATTGGTIEFYGSGFTIQSNVLANKLRLAMNTTASQVVLAANLTHNGLFELNTGTWVVNNTASVARTIQSNGDVLVEQSAQIRPSTTSGNLQHVWNFMGNLLNEGGDVRFTNRAAPAFNATENQQWIVARFVNPISNQQLVCNGITRFSRMVIDKGTDATYTLSITADGPDKFGLFGRCDSSMPENAHITEAANGNSCVLVNGTLEIREHVFLPLQTGTGNFNINASTTLWINGGFAAKGAPDVGAGNATAIVPYGLIRVSAGTLNANCNSGITTRANGVLQVDGGVVNANQIRTSVLGSGHVGGVMIHGGVVQVDGTRPGGVSNDYYTFSLTYPGNLFRMTGGELIVAGPSNRGLIFINSDPEQTNVTGGNIVAQVKVNNRDHRLSTRVPLWNLYIERTDNSTANRPVILTGGNSFGELIPDLPLYVVNNLCIKGANSANLRAISLTNVPQDVHIGGNFLIENGAIYQHGQNTTYFEGNSNSILSLPTVATQTFHNLVIQKSSVDRFAELQQGHATMAIEVQGSFRLEKGYFEYHSRNVRCLGHVVNRSSVGTAASKGVFHLQGTFAQDITSQGAIFHNLTVNNAQGVWLKDDGIRVRHSLTITNGNLYAGNHKVRLEGVDSELLVPAPDASRCIVLSGQASAGGVEIYFKSATQSTLYPIGVADGVSVKYTPAQISINGNFSDDGYVRVVPVNGILPTVNTAGGSDYLNFYWRVSHSDFTAVPRVSHLFTYHPGDVVGNAAAMASGRVLSQTPFTRSIDSLTVTTDHVNAISRQLYYNGPHEAQAMNGPGTPLVNADYTAGNRSIFVGRPKVYYSRSTAYKATWEDPANWNELSSFSPADGPFQWHGSTTSNTGFPQEGDIAVIGFHPSTGKPHVYAPPPGGIQCAEVSFTPMQNSVGARQARWNGSTPDEVTVLRPTLAIAGTPQIANLGQVRGEGALLLEGPIDFSATDMGDFLAQDSSIVIVQTTVSNLELNSFPAAVPNLFITSGSNGADKRGVTILPNTTVRGRLELVGNADLFLSTGLTGDITVLGGLTIAQYQAAASGGRLLFANGGIPRTLDVRGDLRILDAGATIAVHNPNTTEPQVVHRLQVGGNILQHTPSTLGLNLFTSPDADQIDLVLSGTGNHQFTNSAGQIPQLGRLILNKGLDISSSFSFLSPFTLNAPADQALKPIQLQSGLLRINHSDLDVTLSSGGGDFSIPDRAGLELGAGALRISGAETGLLLSGRLILAGGMLEIGNTPGENNYLEYSSGGTARIDLSGGTLSVGSQLRRGLTNTQGVLDFRQSGGNLLVGVHAAPTTNRGVLEVINPGSRFEFTGGNITLVRGVNSSTTPSLLLEPAIHTVSGNTAVYIGNAASPAGAAVKNIGIKSNIALSALYVDNTSGNEPIARLLVYPLQVHDYLEIDQGATLDCGLQDLVVSGDVLNDGTLRATEGKFVINHTSINNIEGQGSFDLNELERTGGGVTMVGTNLEVASHFALFGGIMNFDMQYIRVLGNATVDGEMQFAAGGEGLILSGSTPQMLRRSAPGSTVINILTIDNATGVSMLPGAGHIFNIDRELRMSRGVFDLRGNLLQLGATAGITPVTAFGESNMITTGGAFTNFGIRKTVPANFNQDILIPLGMDKYMPIRLNFGNSGFSSGSTVSSYLFRLNVPHHPVVVDVPNAPEPEINDTQNVLQMWYTLIAQNVGANARLEAEFLYDQSYVAVTNPYNENDYIGARVVDNSPAPDVFKYHGVVDPVNNVMTIFFNNVNAPGISGDYFAGVENAIPNFVPVLTTTRSGNVNEGAPTTGTYDNGVPGNGAPNGAIVRIATGHTLTFNINSVNFYKTIIDEGAVLNIGSTSLHRLGTVEGQGTIRLINTGNLPAGVYNQFFSCTGGRLEYAGSTNYEILSSIPLVRRILLSGSGQRNMANNNVFVCEDLLVQGATLRNQFGRDLTVDGNILLTSGSIDNLQGNLNLMGYLVQSGGTFTAGNAGVRTIHGDIEMTGGTFNNGSGGEVRLLGHFNKLAGTFNGGSGSTVKFVFAGSTPQLIQGDFTGAQAFRTLEVSNPTGITLSGNVDVNTRLRLTAGKIQSSENHILHLANNAVEVVPPGGSSQSFVQGPMNWSLLASASTASLDRIFPVGRGKRSRPLRLSTRSEARTWTVEYRDTVATTNPIVQSMLPFDPIIVRKVSVQEHWVVNSNSAAPTTARVGLSWGPNSGVQPEPNDFQALVVLEYDAAPNHWNSAGAISSSFSYDPITTQGAFMAQNSSLFSQKFFTLGSSLSINPLPVTWLHFTGTTDGNTHTLSWSTASETNNSHFELSRSGDGKTWSVIAQVEGAGNSSTQNDYTYTDPVAPPGRVYYRVRQIDFDGKYQYAPNVVTLLREQPGANEPFNFVLFPNPTTNREARVLLSDVLGAEVTLSIADLSGKNLLRTNVYVNEQGISETFTCNCDIGVYLVSVFANGRMRSKPLVISR